MASRAVRGHQWWCAGRDPCRCTEGWKRAQAEAASSATARVLRSRAGDVVTFAAESDDAVLALEAGLHTRWLVTRVGRGTLELTRTEHVPVPAWQPVVSAWGQAALSSGPDWLMAAAVAVATWQLAWFVAGRVPSVVGLGLALLAGMAGAVLSGALSWQGVHPGKVSRRWARWGYWWAGAVLLVGLSAASLATVLWLARVLGGLAARLAQ
jgi:hypothetical protein